MSKQEENTAQDKPAIELPGRTLRTAREDKGLKIQDIASRLNLELDVVQALEQDDYDALPEPAYIRGYLLSYIRVLGISESLLKAFDELHETHSPLKSTNTAAMTSSDQDGWAKYISSGLVILLIVVIGMWSLEQSFHFVAEAPTSNTSEEILEESTELVTAVEDELMELDATFSDSEQNPAAEQQVALPDGNAEMNSQDVTVIEELLNDTNLAAVVEPTQSPAVSESPSDISILFLDSSWVKVDDAEGKKLSSGIFEKGQKLELNGTVPISLTIGRAKNVELSFRGKPVDLKPYHNKVARLVLGNNSE